MNHISVIIFFLLVCTSNLHCAPLLELEGESNVNLGIFESRLEQKAVFKIKNSGDEVLKIVKVRKTCGCFKVGKFPKELKPGASGDLTITLEPYGLSSVFNKIVFVQSNSSREPIKMLRVSGKAVPLCKVSPSEKLNIYTLQLDKPRSFTFVITPTGKEAMELAAPVFSEQSGLSVSLKKQPSKNGYVLQVTLDAKMKKGLLRLPVKVPVKSPKGWRPVEVLLYGTVK